MNTPNEMTLRDWFAGQALAGMLAFPEHGEKPNDWLARNAWDLADAMLSERERRAKEEAKDDEDASRKANEWVKAAGLMVALGERGRVCVMDGDRALGTGRDVAEAVADTKAKLATDPAPLAPEAKPEPSAPVAEDDEAWARELGVSVHANAPRDGWIAECGHTHSVMGMGRTIAAALRALRAKIEGGAR